MKQKNRETLQRAIGTIEGVYFVAPTKIRDALASIAEMLEALLEGEEND